MKKLFLSLSLSVFCSLLFSQSLNLSGIITDEESKEPLIGASVVVKNSLKGTVTDVDGKYTLTLGKGKYTLVVSYVGYSNLEKVIDLEQDTELNFSLNSSIALKEILVTADVAIDRKTPVAVSSISTQKLREELASQDLPMVLNSTPGVYATQGGGGDGDARVTIRGFNQRNVAVMLDGIPVNDMENGSVFWSNWFGLGLVTKKMEVQRGLGASKVSIPSVGGTINIITKGIESKAGFELKQEYGMGNYLQTTVGFTTGRLKKGWGITGALAYRDNEGIVEGLNSKAYFYFLRIDKEIGKHLLTLSGFGAPQAHGQRGFQDPAYFTDSKKALDIGVRDSFINIAPIKNRGILFNDNFISTTDTTFNSRVNYYHKPQFSFKHSWSISRKTFLANVAYLSIGNGGGTDYDPTSVPTNAETGRTEIKQIFDYNKRPLTSNPTILRSNMNNHFWYGILSTLQHEIKKNHTIKVGVDARYYKGEHYRKVYDLLRGSKYYNTQNARIDGRNTPLYKDDKYSYNYDGFVKWLGGFGLYEVSGNKWNAFINVSGANSSYRLEDYLYAKKINIDGKDNFTSYAPRYADVPLNAAFDNQRKIIYSVENVSPAMYDYAKATGYTIDSTSAQNQVLGWINRPSLTFKTGFNYVLNDNHNVFVNLGYLSKATRFNNVMFTRAVQRGRVLEYRTFINYENEIIQAIELGYQFRSRNFSANLNSYYTNWKNKPVDSPPTVPLNPNDPQGERVPLGISGLGARHLGVELDFAWVATDKLKFEGLASLGDWIWNSKGIQTNPATGEVSEFDPTGVKVGDAAQLQFGGMIRYEPLKRSYITLRGTYFGNNYSNFNPDLLVGANARRQSWKMPDYVIADLNVGHNLKFNKANLDLRFSLLNVFDALYISDSNNNGIGAPTQNFDASSATVFFGLPRRWTVSAEISF